MPPGDTEGLRGAPLSPAGTPGPAMTRIFPVAYSNHAPLYSRVVLDDEGPCGLRKGLYFGASEFEPHHGQQAPLNVALHPLPLLLLFTRSLSHCYLLVALQTSQATSCLRALILAVTPVCMACTT